MNLRWEERIRFHRSGTAVVYPAERYERIQERLSWLTYQRVVFGLHVHVGVPGGDMAMGVIGMLVQYLPHLLAVAANSPFWHGVDTGLSSTRVALYRLLPHAGVPRHFRDWKEFRGLYRVMRDCGAMQSTKDIYWDIRPCPQFGTVEFRICDMPDSLATTFGLVALIRCLVISADFSIRAFALRDAENANGWGLAWYPDRSVTIIKEPLEWRQSLHTKFLESYQGLRSHLYIAHVRHQTTGGPPTHSDTHPFNRELAGRDFCFAHNGTLPAFQDLSVTRYQPVGGTDSEHIFCHLLSKVADRVDLFETESSWQWLHHELSQLNQHGKLNCLFSDGQRLFCYHDTAAWKGLNFRRLRIRLGQERHFEDAGIAFDFKKDGEEQPDNHGYVIATCLLSETGWKSFEPGQLIVIQGGTICFSSHPT